MLLLFVGPARVYLLDFLCSGIQFYLLLSHYLCFISLLYIDLYVLEDDAVISKWSFMHTKYLCVLSTSELRVRLARCETGLSPPVNILLTVPRRYFFCGSFVFFCLVFAMPLCRSVYMCLVVTCLERADPLGSRLWCLTVSLSLSHWYLGSGVKLDCTDS